MASGNDHDGDSIPRIDLAVLVCVGITSNLVLADAPGNHRLSGRASRLTKPSVVNVSQILSVDKRYLMDRVKTVHVKIMRQIDDGLRLVVSL